jgi:hypothetical protein
MTFFEHGMVGINGALAAGLDRRYGWPIVAMAGVSAMLPDWDGLTILLGARVLHHLKADRISGTGVLVVGNAPN